jgi:hypothetical protein
VVGALIATAYDNRLLLAIPFWIILMAFSFAALLRLRVRLRFKALLLGPALVVVLLGLVPSFRYIKGKLRRPSTVYYFVQDQVAVARFMRLVVGGKEPTDPPRLERDEFNRVNSSEPPFDTLVCQKDAYSIIHLFLHDYDDAKILSFSDSLPFNLMSEREIWNANRSALARYTPSGKDLKLVWEMDPKINRILKSLQSLQDLTTHESLSYSFAGQQRTFYVLNIRANDIRAFQERVRALPAL